MPPEDQKYSYYDTSKEAAKAVFNEKKSTYRITWINLDMLSMAGGSVVIEQTISVVGKNYRQAKEKFDVIAESLPTGRWEVWKVEEIL